MTPFQRVVPHTEPIPRCPRPDCGYPGQHVKTLERHRLECRDIVGCGLRTGEHDNFDHALDEWVLMGAIS